jgi:hypothetical protein
MNGWRQKALYLLILTLTPNHADAQTRTPYRWKAKTVTMYKQIRQKDYKKTKYNNTTTMYNGRKYDSMKEANYARDLDWRMKAGEIQEVIPQYKIDLRVNGRHIANYYMDFKTIMADGSVQFHEVKGMVLPLWQMKWALLEALIDEIEPGAEMILIK